jgi:uncharacterized protein YecE (DUF72 family)
MIKVGIGGWTFEEWRGGVFYPKGLPQTRELSHASRQVTTIEINGTYYSTQKPESFRRWAADTPEDFVFSVKASRFTTNRRVLAEAGESIERFVGSGIAQLKHKLGPILWQFAPTKKFDEADFGGFLEHLPPDLDGRKLRHVVEVRHDSFCTPGFLALVRKFNVAVVFSEHDTYPAIADITGDVVYARLQKGEDAIKTGYPPKALNAWAERVRLWAEGGEPADLPHVDPKHRPSKTPREVFAYFIHEGKVNAPAAAMALIERLQKAA